MSAFEVLSPGLLSTLQDAGRFGYEAFGVPPSGVMDTLSFRMANALVGNSEDIGVLEFTLTGPTLKLWGDKPCLFAVTGDAVLTLNGQNIDICTSHVMYPEDVLKIPRLRSGTRGYLAVSGGFDVPLQLGSISTLLRAGLGGIKGGALQKNTQLALHSPAVLPSAGIRSERIFPQREKRPIRVIWGPQDPYFSDETRRLFLSHRYMLSGQSDRMGYRLQGTPLSHRQGFNIISDAIAHGSIQIPGDGLPIIAMNDRQTTGGYPKIATVIRADLARLGQMKPGDSLSFEAVSVEKAESLWQGRQMILNQKITELSRQHGFFTDEKKYD